jgi:hypothetical protein
MITIVYNYDPNLSYERHHTGRLHKCTERGIRRFNYSEKAIAFWMECTKPETELGEIMEAKEFNKETITTLKHRVNELEEFVSSNLVENYAEEDIDIS